MSMVDGTNKVIQGHVTQGKDSGEDVQWKCRGKKVVVEEW